MKSIDCRSLAVCAWCLFVTLQPFQAVAEERFATVIRGIEALESDKEPKCYATASRLEDFMFGTPLTDDARFRKHELEQAWIAGLWLPASGRAAAEGRNEVTFDDVLAVLSSSFRFAREADGHWLVEFTGNRTLRINATDERQYASIAYSLRSILAVEQTLMWQADSELLPLTQSAIDLLSSALDLYTLTVLKVADERARMADARSVSKAEIELVWNGLSDISRPPVAPRAAPAAAADLALLRSIIEQKINSYEKYNQVTNQLFVRNLQVYFARSTWPSDPEVARVFREQFAATLTAFAGDLYRGSEELAKSRQHGVIQESDVARYAQRILPHEINEYEDALFFPRLPHADRVAIESYDMDAFRDSGIHWLYLERAIDAPDFAPVLELDPFAAELLVENVAQFGVLVLRMTGAAGRAAGHARIAPEHLGAAMVTIQDRADRHAAAAPKKRAAGQLASSSASDSTRDSGANRFTDISEMVAVEFTHRSSDWLNRLLRSFLRKDEQTGIITIPPAFGGAGVAAEDVNNDGWVDLLVLSGLGNRLYLNRDGARFEDVTEQAGLEWFRAADRRPGEPRQPLIADLDNDGWQDIVVTYVDDEHRVYRNLGNGRFEDMTGRAGLGGSSLVGGPATTFDFDNDGLLDIYVTYFGDYLNGVLPTLERRNFNGLSNRLFRNEGNFEFSEVTGSGLENSGWAQAVTHSDLDGDGWQDVIVGNDFGVNAYYLNQGDGKFVDVAEEIGTNKPSYTMSIGLADLNDDLVPDIYISNIVTMNKDETYVLPTRETQMKFDAVKLANMRVIEANDLFLSEPAVAPGTISYVLSDAVGRGYSSTGWSWDADFFDADNDGDDDLYVLNGMNEFNLYSSENPYYTDPLENEKKNVYIPVATKESNVYFENDGGRLLNAAEGSGLDLLGNSRSAAYLDYDHDGDLDILVGNYHDDFAFYRNELARGEGNWLGVRLVGDVAAGVNRDAIGSRIVVETPSGNVVFREVRGSTGYMSVHPKLQHVGLGGEDSARVTVHWPDGSNTVVDAVAANQVVRIDQAKGVVPASGS